MKLDIKLSAMLLGVNLLAACGNLPAETVDISAFSEITSNYLESRLDKNIDLKKLSLEKAEIVSERELKRKLIEENHLMHGPEFTLLEAKLYTHSKFDVLYDVNQDEEVKVGEQTQVRTVYQVKNNENEYLALSVKDPLSDKGVGGYSSKVMLKQPQNLDELYSSEWYLENLNPFLDNTDFYILEKGLVLLVSKIPEDKEGTKVLRLVSVKEQKVDFYAHAIVDQVGQVSLRHELAPLTEAQAEESLNLFKKEQFNVSYLVNEMEGWVNIYSKTQGDKKLLKLSFDQALDLTIETLKTNYLKE